MKTEELWSIIDKRTGLCVTVACFYTKEQAEDQIERWKERDRRGGRQDVHDQIPYLEARRIW